jgi:hypothetical protein
MAWITSLGTWPLVSPNATSTDLVGKILYLRLNYHFGPRQDLDVPQAVPSIVEQHSKPTGLQVGSRAQELRLVFFGITMALPLLLNPTGVVSSCRRRGTR